MASSTPGTTLAQDTFQRANQTHWGTAANGQTWGGDANSQSAFAIASNTGQVTNGGTIYNAVLGSTAANAEVLYGSYNTVRTNVYGSYRLSEHVGLSLNVNYYNTDGYVVAPRELRGPIDTRAASQAGNVQVKTDYHDTGIDWFLRGNFFTQDQNTGTVLSDNSTNRVDIATGAK